MKGQEANSPDLQLQYNKKLGLLGFNTNIIINDSINREKVYYRIIHWYKYEFQKLNVVISLKDSIDDGKNDSVLNPNNEMRSMRRFAENGEFRIDGRYLDYYQIKRFGANNGLEICGRIKIIIKSNNNIRLTFSHFTLPNFGTLPLEVEVLEPSFEFKKPYRNLESEMSSKASFLVDDLTNWINNYYVKLDEDKQWNTLEKADKGRKNRKKKDRKNKNKKDT